MSEHLALVVFGDWRVRHAEPPLDDRPALRLQRLPLRSGERCAQADCRGTHAVLAWLGEGHWQAAEAGARAACCNVDPDWVPLAHVEVEAGGERLRVRHLIDRADGHVAHFIAPPRPLPPCGLDGLVRALRDGFEAHHLQTNNFECHHAQHGAVPERWLGVDAAGAVDVRALGDAWLDALEDDRMRPFVAQIGDELQHALHDNLLCAVLPGTGGTEGWVNAAFFSRQRRATVLEPLAEFGSWLRRGASAPWVLHTEADRRCDGAAEVALAQHFELPLRRVAPWRHAQAVVGCESLDSGNLFGVAFSSALRLDAGARAAPLLQASVAYRRTRGPGSAACVAHEQAQLLAGLRRWLRAHALAPTGAGTEPPEPPEPHLYARIAAQGDPA